MDENIKFILESTTEGMEKALVHFEGELSKIRAGKANPIMLNGIMVDYYGALTPLIQVAAVSAPDARMLMVTPFDKSALGNIERAIIEANLGLNPNNDGAIIRLPVPILTEERRKQLVKQANSEGENAKIGIRNVRREHIEATKKLKDEGVSEDMIKDGEGEIQKITDAFTAKVDDSLKKKDAEIMTI